MPTSTIDLATGVYSVSYSPDGATLAAVVASPDEDTGELMLWDAKSLTQRLVIPSSRGTISNDWIEGKADLVFSPDTKLLAVRRLPVDGAGAISVWDTGTGEQTWEFSVGRNRIMSMSLALDGKTLAIITGRGLELRDFRTGDLLPAPAPLDLSRLVTKPFVVRFSPDGKTLAIGGIYKTEGQRSYGGIAFWNMRNREFTNHSYLSTSRSNTEIISIAFGPDGKTVYAASMDGSVWKFLPSSPIPQN